MRITALLLMSVLLISCSSQFAYRHLDWIIFWYSDDYLELNRQQTRLFESELQHVLLWHETAELPKYRAQLQDIHDDLANLPLSKTMIHGHMSAAFAHWQRVREIISERFAPLTGQLNPTQIEFLFAQLEERNQQRLDEHADKTSNDIMAEKLEQWSENLSELLGDINPKQQALLERLIPQLHDLTLLRVDYLRAYQTELKLAMLNQESSETSSRVAYLLSNPDAFKSDIYQKKLQENRDKILNFILNISQHFKAKQVAHLQDEIKEYMDMIDDILNDQ